MDQVDADHRTRRTLIRPAIQPEHGDLLGLTGLPVGRKQRTIQGPRVWASLIFCCPFAFGGPLDLVLRLCESTVPTWGCCRKRTGGSPCQEALRDVQTGAMSGEPIKKGTKVERGERRGGRICQCGSLYFLNCMSSSRNYDAWLLIQQVLTDCLDSSRPPHPIFGQPGEIITLFCPQLSLASGKCQ
jgi:hypothetical protein